MGLLVMAVALCFLATPAAAEPAAPVTRDPLLPGPERPQELAADGLVGLGWGEPGRREQGPGAALDLQRRPDGGYEYRSTSGLRATIDADGRVDFRHAAPPGRFSLGLLNERNRLYLGRANVRKPRAYTDRFSREHLPQPPDLDAARIERDASHGLPPPVIFGVGVSLPSLADIASQSARSREVQEFLDATAGLRAQLAHKARKRDRTRALLELGRTLTAIRRDTGRTPDARRQAIFEIWSEVYEPEGPNAALHPEARERIERFVRLFLPNSSPAGYSREQLERLNRYRGGRARFDPYRSVTRDTPERAEDHMSLVRDLE